MRNLLAIFVLLLLAAPASSDADLLDDPWAVAWLGWYAGETGDETLVPKLKEALRRPATDEAARYSRLYVLDALIRLEVRVGKEDLLPALDGFFYAKAPAVILAARHSDPETRLAVFEKLDPWYEDEWVALGNVLAREKTPGFASRLLDGLSTELRIYVSDDSDFKVEGPWPRSYVSGSRVDHVPGGMPPLPVYWLSDTDYDWAEQREVSSGYQTIYSARTTKEEESFLWSGSSGRLDHHAVARHWIETLLGKPTKFAWPGGTIRKRVIHPTSDKVYWRRIRYARQDVELLYGKLAEQLVKAGLITRADAKKLNPEIERKIIDVRQRKKRPLPPPEPPPPPKPKPRPKKKPIRLR